MIARRTVAALSLSQLVCWGVTFYAVGVFGERMVADIGWPRAVVHGGFSLALVVMGLASPALGRLVDRIGGRGVMATGSVAAACGLALLASAHHLAVWFLAWGILGAAMRMILYDACFATLVRLDPLAARRAITTVTLAGGLASTVFWFVGEALATRLGWRGATLVFAGLALATLPLHLAIPRPTPAGERSGEAAAAPTLPPPLVVDPAEIRRATLLFATLAISTSVLASALAAHMIALLVALGLAAPTAVAVAALRGIGQSSARFAEFATGSRLHPLDLALLACALLPLSLAFAPFAGAGVAAAVIFSAGGGCGNGLVTLVRGSVPLVLFDPRAYGRITGTIAAPALWASALAPFVVAFALDRGGVALALAVLAVPAVAACLAALALRRFRRGAAPKPRAAA